MMQTIVLSAFPANRNYFNPRLLRMKILWLDNSEPRGSAGDENQNVSQDCDNTALAHFRQFKRRRKVLCRPSSSSII